MNIIEKELWDEFSSPVDEAVYLLNANKKVLMVSELDDGEWGIGNNRMDANDVAFCIALLQRHLNKLWGLT